MPRTLNVKATSIMEIREKWGVVLPMSGDLYIRCNVKGEINWKNSLVYPAALLIERNNVHIIH